MKKEILFYFVLFIVSLFFPEEINQVNILAIYLFKLFFSSIPLLSILYLIYFIYNKIKPYLKYITCLDKIFIEQDINNYKTCIE